MPELLNKLGIKDFVLRGLKARQCSDLIELYTTAAKELSALESVNQTKVLQSQSMQSVLSKKPAYGKAIALFKEINELEDKKALATDRNETTKLTKLIEAKEKEYSEQSASLDPDWLDLFEKNTQLEIASKDKPESDLIQKEKQIIENKILDLFVNDPSLLAGAFAAAADTEMQAKIKAKKQEVQQAYFNFLNELIDTLGISDDVVNQLSNQDLDELVSGVVNTKDNRIPDFFIKNVNPRQ